MNFMTFVKIDDKSLTVGELLASWANRVRGISIETVSLREGVEGRITADDYIGFLHFRSILESALQPLGMADDSPESTILKAIDSCFMALTEVDEEGLIEAMDPLLTGTSRSGQWWNERIPRRGALGFEIAQVERRMRAVRASRLRVNRRKG